MYFEVCYIYLVSTNRFLQKLSLVVSHAVAKMHVNVSAMLLVSSKSGHRLFLLLLLLLRLENTVVKATALFLSQASHTSERASTF